MSYKLFLSQIFTFGCRYKHRSVDGARTWIEPAAGTNYHAFNEVFVLGSAQLAVLPLGGFQAPVRFHADRLYGDKSGFLHVGYNQKFSVAVTDPDIPFGLRVYQNGSIMLPRRAFLQTVSFKSSGKVRYSFTTRWIPVIGISMQNFAQGSYFHFVQVELEFGTQRKTSCGRPGLKYFVRPSVNFITSIQK